MTSMKTIQSKAQARIWKNIAKSDLDLSAIPETDLERLVEIITDAVILEIDDELGQELLEDRRRENIVLGEQPDKEMVLWSGRPLLSIATEYIITSERLRIIRGLLGKDKADIELIRIQDIDQHQSVGERLLSVGDIIIRSHDRSSPDIVLNNVRDPESVHSILRRAVVAARKDQGIQFQEEM